MKDSKDKEFYFIEDKYFGSYKERSKIGSKKRMEKRIKLLSALLIGGFVAFIALYNSLFPYLSSAASGNKSPKDNMITSVDQEEYEDYGEYPNDFDEESLNGGSSKKRTTKKKMMAKDHESISVLVNKQIFLPDGYEPDDLVIPDVKFSFSGYQEKKLLRKEAARALEELFQASIEEGLKFVAVSGYRSYDRQYTIFTTNVRKNGLDDTLKVSAMPGSSEHQTGLSMDVSTKAVSFLLRERFAQTPEGEWLAQNAYKYGYIIRYPKGKERITGYSFEPWHLRYVGKELASHLYENDLTLEEYYEFEIDPFYYNGITYENIHNFGINPEDIKVKTPKRKPRKSTQAPVLSPTPEVSQEPEISPSPEVSPTGEETEVPSTSPTQEPSQEPTPSSGPTTTPTNTPTPTPTSKPTNAPTATPTSKPTATPTSKPTSAPTATPSPTTTPSPTPTTTPTNPPKPTVTPSPTPTNPPEQDKSDKDGDQGGKGDDIQGTQGSQGAVE